MNIPMDKARERYFSPCRQLLIKTGDTGTYFLRSLSVKIARGKKNVILSGDVLAKIVILNAKKVMTLAHGMVHQYPQPIPINDSEHCFAEIKNYLQMVIFYLGKLLMKLMNLATSVVLISYSHTFNLSCKEMAPCTRSPTVGMRNTFAPTQSPSQVSAGSSAGNQPPLLVDE